MDTLATPRLDIPIMEKSRRGIQSVEIGSALLLQLARHVRPLALKDLAKASGMTAGKAHPYMVSFLKVGFVTQTEAGHYELGPLALQLGLTRLQRMDPVKEASQLIEALANDSGQSIAVAVWGNLGPTIVRLEEPIEPLHVNLRTGTVMSLTNTATGRLFAAYMPPKVVERILNDELQRLGTRKDAKGAPEHEELDAALAETRDDGAARLALANKFVSLMQGEELGAALGQMTSMMMPAELEGMSEDEAAKFRAVMGEVTARMMPRMFEAMAPIYADIFTLEELQALVDFYQSDVGRSMVTKSYQAAPRLAEAVQAIMPEIMAEMGNVLCDEFECTAEQRREMKAAMSQAVGR